MSGHGAEHPRRDIVDREAPLTLSDVDTLSRLASLVARPTRSSPDPLPLGALLEEADAWLTDDRQWRRGGQRHWRSLLDHIGDEVAFLRTLSAGEDQTSLGETRARLKTLRNDFPPMGEPDDVLRRQLFRLMADLRGCLTADSLLETAWPRAVDWVRTSHKELGHAFQTIHDLAELRGQDAKDTFDRLNRVLADSASEIAYLSGESPPGDPRALSGKTIGQRLDLGVAVLLGPTAQATGVVWLEFLQAHLWHPSTLELSLNPPIR